MAQLNITENEYNKIKTICEFLFFDQYQEAASFTRFEKCFQPLFCSIENISFMKIFKDIVGPKKKYITYKRFLKAELFTSPFKASTSVTSMVFPLTARARPLPSRQMTMLRLKRSSMQPE